MDQVEKPRIALHTKNQRSWRDEVKKPMLGGWQQCSSVSHYKEMIVCSTTPIKLTSTKELRNQQNLNLCNLVEVLKIERTSSAAQPKNLNGKEKYMSTFLYYSLLARNMNLQKPPTAA
jgi:hypothetical protein